MKKCVLAILLTSLFSCTHKPTKVYTTEDVDTLFLQKTLTRPIEITNETVILDARAPFEFAVAHYPQAINLQWTDFTDPRGRYPGRLNTDLADATRRLALLSITPQTHVVVVGDGIKGKGDEGRLAWTLLYLGVQKVQTAEVGALGMHYSNIVPPPRANAPRWDPVVRSSLLATKEEVIKVATSKFDDRVHLLDVRSKDEYFSKNVNLQYELPDLRAINIEWVEFFTPQGRPKPGIREQLKAINVNPEDRVIVISNNGIRSGAVTYALVTLGYKNAANFAGGYTELIK